MSELNLRIGFIGLGLIGGSIAKAIKRIHPKYIIIAYDTDTKSLTAAYKHKVVDVVCSSIDDNFRDLNIIYLCAPVQHNITCLEPLKKLINSNCIITDVGSVKSNIHEKIIEYSLENNFIGGHPMAGSERFGYSNSGDRLLENAYYIITPTDKVDSSMVDRIFKLTEDIGAIPIVIGYKQHDYVTAAISHLPHIVASGLVNLVKASDDEGYMKLLAAGGFKDITRIASSSPIMWQQICLSNGEFIKTMLSKYIELLSFISESIDMGNESYLYDFFNSAREYRDVIPNSSPGILSRVYHIFVDIIDESGAIATIATLLSGNNINIKNIGIIHNREFSDGVLRIEFYSDEPMASSVKLLKECGYIVYERD